MLRSDYEEMPLQNGRAIKATAKYQDESDSDWWMGGRPSISRYCVCVNKEYFPWWYKMMHCKCT